MRTSLRQLSAFKRLVSETSTQGRRALQSSSPNKALAAVEQTQELSYAVAYKPESLELLQLDTEHVADRLELNYRWLRDHCTCPACYNHSTNQRRLQPMDLPPSDTGPAHVSVQVMTKEDAVTSVLSDILKHGIALVEGVSATDPEETKSLTERIALLQETFYGSFWVIDPTKDGLAYADTAYTSEGIDCHTDNTYYRNTAGVQVFHIMKQAAEGGENIFVDGFKAIQILQQTNYEAFRFLSSTRIKHHFRGPGVHLECDEPIISLNPDTGEFVQLRYNPYDRAPLDNLSAQQTKQFYQAYQALQNIINSSEMEYRVKLEPGSVLFVDNWRCLHGRTAFKGSRILAGSYLSRDDFLSKCRSHNL